MLFLGHMASEVLGNLITYWGSVLPILCDGSFYGCGLGMCTQSMFLNKLLVAQVGSVDCLL